jgi:hypothetical protein
MAPLIGDHQLVFRLEVLALGDFREQTAFVSSCWLPALMVPLMLPPLETATTV